MRIEVYNYEIHFSIYNILLVVYFAYKIGIRNVDKIKLNLNLVRNECMRASLSTKGVRTTKAYTLKS